MYILGEICILRGGCMAQESPYKRQLRAKQCHPMDWSITSQNDYLPKVLSPASDRDIVTQEQ